MNTTNVLIIGAGASGLMCARAAAQRGRDVLVLDHAPRIGQKILISGGGRCNFTNRFVDAEHYLSQNPHFCKSALRRFTPDDMFDLLERYHVPYEERTLGQLFCQKSAKAIVDLLVKECQQAGARIQTHCAVRQVSKEGRFLIHTTQDSYSAESLVIATGGLSYAEIGASGFGYDIARQFGLNVLPCSPGLVPLTVSKEILKQIQPLSGIAVDTIISCKERSFREALLFTHTGLSGPVILQISNYWQPGDELGINLLPDHDLTSQIPQWQRERPKAYVKNLLAILLPKRLIQQILPATYADMPVNHCNVKDIAYIADSLQHWRLTPSGTEGYHKAEVTKGGVDTNELSSKTFEARCVKGLYFVGEVLDVTGWLGGYNLQWAWSSGYCAGQYV